MNNKKENSYYIPFNAEKEVLDFWDNAEIFKKSLKKSSLKNDYVFYDGPPFATGTPHYGHIVASTIKDVIPRYKTMTGYRVERKWGWDCHGLPIENIAEKELAIKRKKDIEKMGITKFNKLCRSKVLSYVKSWKLIIKRLGRWVDMENSYSTMDLNFMESVWWIFKELWKKDLIYESYRSMHICPRCETTLSQAEVSEGYKMVKDLSVVVKFKIEPNQRIGNFISDNNTYILSWTTTPWTLIGNVALAVKKNIKYAVIDMDKQSKKLHGKFIIAIDRIVLIEKNTEKKKVNKPFEVDILISGKDLIGIKYISIFHYYYNNNELENRENGWKIYNGDFVTTESGTGIVHIASAFGEDDMNLAKKYNLPFIQHVNMDGTIKKEIKDFSGMNVKPIGDNQKTDVEIIKYLDRHNLLFKKEKFEHSYPYCWRCDTPLINYATSSWFVNIQKIKKEAIDLANNINWFPSHIKKGRFGNWLTEAHDWSISRQRFWASVIPIWKCSCGEIKVFGSILELEKISGQKITDIHKHIVDKIKFPCNKCGKEMSRVADVLDTWFDSASMPYSQIHYPFENKEKFEHNFPAEFIGEGIDQTRCWFYYLHVIGVAIKHSNAFKNVIVNGIVLAEDGKKMSKKLKNYPDPLLILNKYGADALRFYLITSPIVAAENLNFSEDEIKNTLRKNISTLWNIFKFYELFKKDNLINFNSLNFSDVFKKSDNILDKWILIKLNKLINEVTKNMEKYNLSSAARPITDFINDLSTWYLRRSRIRFKSEEKKEKDSALKTMFFVLNQTSKIIAPFTPFIAEQIWQKINNINFRNYKKSVHLETWPTAHILNKKELDLLEKIDLSRRIVEIGLAIRNNKGIKIRQPLNKMKIKASSNLLRRLDKNYANLIKEEINVKDIEFIEHSGILSVELDTNITSELRSEGLVREIIRTINSLRKEAGFSINDSAELLYSNNKNLNNILNKFGKDILKRTYCAEYKRSDMSKVKLKKEILVFEKKELVGIKINN